MRIGIDVSTWGNKRGIGRFTRELVTALLKVETDYEYLFFVDSQTFKSHSFPKQMAIVPVTTGTSPESGLTLGSSRPLKDVWAFARAVGTSRLDAVFLPFWSLYFPILDRRTKVVSTIHDLIEYQHRSSIPTARWLLMRAKHQLCLSRSSAIVTPSRYSKQQVVDRFRVAEEKVHVIPEAASRLFQPRTGETLYPDTLRKREILPGRRFLLFVGSLDAHKGLAILLQAYAELVADAAFTDVKLVIVGAHENAMLSSRADLEQGVRRGDLSGSVIVTGFVSDEDLLALYQFATLVVMPSSAEGFGLPALEAMACATPVLASSAGSLPEVVGSSGDFFAPNDAGALFAKLRDVVNQTEQLKRMAAYGLQRAQSFSWSNSARSLAALLERVGNG